MAVRSGRSILILSTAQRSLPVTRRSLDIAAQQAHVQSEITGRVVTGAKAALDSGDLSAHNQLILSAMDDSDRFDVIMFGQMSMEPALAEAAPELAARIITPPRASAMRAEGRRVGKEGVRT